jgi:hypothetical protein
MASENSQSRQPWRVAFGEAPVKGSKALQQALDFSVENPVNINLSYEQASDKLEWVQTLYVDNSANPAALKVTFRNTNQAFSVPGGWQGYIPVLAPADNCHAAFSTSGTPVVPVWFLNFPMAPELWPANGITPVINSNPAAILSGQVKIAATGTAIQLPSNALVNGVTIRAKATNNAAGGTAGPAGDTNTVDGTGNGYILAPGDGISYGVSNSNAVFVNGTTGDIFSWTGN